METGQRGASARDIRDLARLYNLDDAYRQRLTDLAAEGKQHAWWQPLGLPDSYSTYVGLESEASVIRDFGLGLIPGLLQTREYAQSVLRATVPHRSDNEVEQRVEARMSRQERVLSLDSPPDLHAIIDISVLHRVVGDRNIMLRQLKHLLEASQMRNLTVQVIPFGVGALPVANNKFIILSFASPELSDVVFIEGLSGDLYLDHSEDINTYAVAFRELEELAATSGETQAIVSALIDADPASDRPMR
jgi:hypothetical protein